MKIKCPVSLGELIDKISILRIKMEKIEDKEKVRIVIKEESLLVDILETLSLKGVDDYEAKLREINRVLWEIEDAIREEERNNRFDSDFIRLARAVYTTNDKRFAIKSEINRKYSSDIEEVKSYQNYI